MLGLKCLLLFCLFYLSEYLDVYSEFPEVTPVILSAHLQQQMLVFNKSTRQTQKLIKIKLGN